VISKKDFADWDVSEYTDQTIIARATADFTSGSTGVPFNFFFDRSAELRSFAICERMFITGAGKRYPVVAMRARHKPGFAFHDHRFFYLMGSNSLPHRFDDLVEVGKTFPNGFILYGYPSALVETAHLAEERGTSLPVRALIGTGEPVAQEQRVFAEQALHTKFFINYAGRDMGWLGYECEHHAMHLNEEWAYVEIVDGQGLPVEPGEEGAIVVTLFDNRTMPLIRYNGGDRGVMRSEPCTCGRTLRTITVSGRQSDLIEFPGGRAVPLINLSGSLDRYASALRQFQIVQTSALGFTIRAIPGPEFEVFREQILGRVIRLLHPDVQVKWELVEDIPPTKTGKAVYFVRELGSS
jgi:phenylacetate-CoA ligase